MLNKKKKKHHTKQKENIYPNRKYKKSLKCTRSHNAFVGTHKKLKMHIQSVLPDTNIKQLCGQWYVQVSELYIAECHK